MIPDAQTRSEVVSTVTGDDVLMGIDIEDMPHIMELLSKGLYSDGPLAVVRELSTNARDANDEAGFPGPIEVTTPSPLKPVLTISDNGPGLDREAIETIYSQYGKSTKRGTNTQVGQLGLGCKSPFAYTDQFTVVGIKNGVKTTVNVSRDEDGLGRMKLVSETETDEASGVTVQIPARAGGSDLQEACDSFFRFWEPGTVLVNGSEPLPIDGYRLTDDLLVVDGEDTDWVVQGNVAYPANLEIFRRSYRGKHVVARVPIGSVDFPPSREALRETQRTLATLQKIKDDFAAAAKVAIERDVSAAATKPEAVFALIEACRALELTPSNTEIKYNGEAVPAYIGDHKATSYFRADEPSPMSSFQKSTYGGRGRGRVSKRSAMAFGDLRPEGYNAPVFITACSLLKWGAVQYDKTIAYFEAHGGDTGSTVFVIVRTPEPPLKEWLPDGTRHADWETIKKWKDPNAPKAAGRKITGTYLAREHDSYGSSATPVSEIADHKGSLVWRRAKAYASAPDAIWDADATVMLVDLPENRVAKFCRDFPQAEAFDDFKVRQTAQAMASWTKRERQIFAWGEPDHSDLCILDCAKIDDPAVVAYVKACEERQALLGKKFRKLFWEDNAILEPLPDGLWTDARLEERYKLLGTYINVDKAVAEDFILYLNAAYAARKDA